MYLIYMYNSVYIYNVASFPGLGVTIAESMFFIHFGDAYQKYRL